jgi:hypothetical protein
MPKLLSALRGTQGPEEPTSQNIALEDRERYDWMGLRWK